MIAIVDYGMGNVRSVLNAFDYLGHDAVISSDPAVIEDAERIVLPGVGAFGDAIANLRSRGLVEVLHEQVLVKKKPFLGICLGMQLLAKSSTEHGLHEGLGWLDAEVVRFGNGNGSLNGLKIPHMGWNEIVPARDHPLLERLPAKQRSFYFVHSYHIICHDQTDSLASSEYGYKFTVAVHRENIFATQFHPEKSQDNGLQVLQNFVTGAP
ncbi:MAG TPA: imidazole glycerol phosphate synthase subunit HisH [Thermoanaerobaculia bacterium]|nr:imidazole glycerol phosphate synthase subunit HisH [Thermoanaerobaculia bacterium]